MGAGHDGRAAGAAELYQRYGPALHRYALMILGNRQDCEDVVQQVFVALLRRGAIDFESPEAYLRTAVRNESFSLLRKRPPAAAQNAEALLEPLAAVPDRPDERLALEGALHTLPADQREVVHLKVYEGLTLQQIADLTSESINTVASRYRYAMAKLKVALTRTDHG